MDAHQQEDPSSKALQRQLAREQEQRRKGAEAYDAARERAVKDEAVSVATVFGRTVLDACLRPVAEAMEAYSQQQQDSGKFRRMLDRHRFHLKEVEDESRPGIGGHEDLDVFAVVAGRVLGKLLDMPTEQKSDTATTGRVADALEEAARHAFYSEKATPHQRAIQLRGLKGASKLYFQAPEFLAELGKMGWEPWKAGDRIHFAQACINIVVETVQYKDHPVFDRDGSLTRHGLAWMTQEEDLVRLLANQKKPMLAVDGGDGHYLANQRVLTVELTPLAQALAALGLTDWTINRRVLDVMGADYTRELEEKQPRLPRLPEDAPKAERQRVGLLKRLRKARRAKLHQKKLVTMEARDNVGEVIRFPHDTDFRSRMYPEPAHLHPIGPDVMRGVLQFAEGKPIVTTDARKWLAVHGANCFGETKRDNFEARVKWVEEHTEQIKTTSTDQSVGAWWRKAGDPYQFLAFCIEWTAYQAQGEGFPQGDSPRTVFRSHLPVVADGTCNGLQHYAALLRDETLGRRVNLLDDERPHDVYQDVADKVVERLKVEDGVAYGKRVRARKAHKGKGKAELAVVADAARADAVRLSKVWLNSGWVDRKLLKGPVMTMSYGAGRKSVRKAVREYVLEKCVGPKIQRHEPHALAEEEVFVAVDYLAGVAYQEVTEMISTAMTAQRWIKGFIKGVVGARVFSWTTPAGATVESDYKVMRKSRVAGKHSRTGRAWSREVREETELVNIIKQSMALPPNIVHSIDAAHAQRTAVEAKARGVGSLTMIHDCFGTHAADMEVLSTVLREQFSAIYHKSPDLLRDTIREIIRPFVDESDDALADPKVRGLWEDKMRGPGAVSYELPFGNLDVREVLKSKFFFS